MATEREKEKKKKKKKAVVKKERWSLMRGSCASMGRILEGKKKTEKKKKKKSRQKCL